MDKNLNSAGYDLYEASYTHWAIHTKDGPVFVGSFKDVATHMVSQLGFKLDEIEYAVKTMIEKNHNGAHFGMYRGFIFTFQKEFKHDKQAS
jgi:hypothetical protein